MCTLPPRYSFEYAFLASARSLVCFDISRVHESLVIPLETCVHKQVEWSTGWKEEGEEAGRAGGSVGEEQRDIERKNRG